MYTPRQTPPFWADTPPFWADTPKTVTAADGMHPTGMHSCWISIIWSFWRWFSSPMLSQINRSREVLLSRYFSPCLLNILNLHVWEVVAAGFHAILIQLLLWHYTAQSQGRRDLVDLSRIIESGRPICYIPILPSPFPLSSLRPPVAVPSLDAPYPP